MRLNTVGLASLLLAVSLPGWTDATVYRWKDASGQVHFSQTPPTSGNYDVMGGAHVAPITPPATMPAPPAAPSAAATSASADQRTREQRFIEEAEAARKAKADAKEKEKTAKAEKDKRCSAARDYAKLMENNFERIGGDDIVRQRDAALKDVATNCS